MDYKHYVEVQPIRGIHDNFSSGQINYKFNFSGRDTWCPLKTFFKIKLKISKGNGNRLDKNFGVAPNMNVCDNLWQQIDMKANGKRISCWNDYIAQCATLIHRIHVPVNERNSLMSSINYSQIYLNDRLNDVSIDGDGKGSSGHRVELIDLNDNAGANVGIAETITINANALNVLVYAGAIDLTQTDLKVGDVVYIKNLGVIINFSAVIVLIEAGQITLDRNAPNAIGATNIARNLIYHIPSKGDGVAQQSNDWDLIWRPPIGFFQIREEICGDFHLELTPHASGLWEKYAVEAFTNREIGVGADQIKVELTSINMYALVHTHPSPYSGNVNVKIQDVMCNSQNLTTNSLTSNMSNIHPRNFAVVVAFQDANAGNDIRLSRSKFKISGNLEKNLTRFYLQKDGITLPDPIDQILVDQAGGINNIIQKYYETLQYSDSYININQPETVKEWLDCGFYLYYKSGKGYSKGEQLRVYTSFSQAFESNPQILIFDLYETGLSFKMSNGQMSLSVQE